MCQRLDGLQVWWPCRVLREGRRACISPYTPPHLLSSDLSRLWVTLGDRSYRQVRLARIHTPSDLASFPTIVHPRGHHPAWPSACVLRRTWLCWRPSCSGTTCRLAGHLFCQPPWARSRPHSPTSTSTSTSDFSRSCRTDALPSNSIIRQ